MGAIYLVPLRLDDAARLGRRGQQLNGDLRLGLGDLVGEGLLAPCLGIGLQYLLLGRPGVSLALRPCRRMAMPQGV